MIDVVTIIAKVRHEHAEIERKLSVPGVFSDRQQSASLSREHQRLSALLAQADIITRLQTELAQNKSMLEQETDAALRELILADIQRVMEQLPATEAQLLALAIPPGDNDSRNTLVEIRPAAGGDEAGLFADDLFRMYVKFAERQKWKMELLHISEGALKGIKEVAFALMGADVYRKMQFEAGVHRVQRIPVTEASGRIHTSTVTVAVLPEPKEVDIEIRPDELRIDVYRSSGPGGQSVNRTDSAVRITHLPTGVAVASQQERSQHRNKEIAMRILRARLLEAKQQEERKKHADERKTQVGTGERSERIRTYNFPQNRVTDHRYGISCYNLSEIMDGGLHVLLDQVLALDSKRRLHAEFGVGEGISAEPVEVE